jgi:threonylcarbamoyladenosine tRNA methylthiotransferase MtaB
MPKFFIATLGCKVNQAESEAIAQELMSADWTAAADGQKADVCIVNTCTVTGKASMQSRQAVRRAIRTHPGARILVTGCYAQTSPEDIQNIKGVHYIVGHAEKQTVGHLVRTLDGKIPAGAIRISGDLDPETPFESKNPPPPLADSRTRPFLKIQDGCNAFCTYCIVPYARGRSRSMPIENVLQCIQQIAAAGYHEVVLTGIHLGAYGHDLIPATHLGQLLERIQATGCIDRVRLSSIEPFELTQEIIDRIAGCEIFCRHFHIPLQSGDDAILKKMGRPYSRRGFESLVSRIHRAMPEAAIGVDTLIGFPGENKAAFANTYEMIAALPVSYLHVFPFSVRPGTAAEKFADKIDSAVIKKRCEQMRRLGNKKRADFYRQFIGQTRQILVESKRDAPTGMLKGISSNYLPVLADGGDKLKNMLVEVKIQKIEGNKLFGVLHS